MWSKSPGKRVAGPAARPRRGSSARPRCPAPGRCGSHPGRSAPLGADESGHLWMKYSRTEDPPLAPSSVLGIFKLNISPLSISEPLGDEAEINRSAGRSPGSGRRQLMHQIPPRCLMFQGYDRTVYKTSSVIYTVIISRGALNFRFTCSFNSVPWFRLIPEYFLGESRSGAAPCPGAAGPPRSRGCIAVTPPAKPSAPSGRRGAAAGTGER